MTTPPSGSHAHGHSAPAAGGEPGASRFTEEIAQEAFVEIGRTVAHDAHGRWALHIAHAMKRFPGGKLALKAMVRFATGATARALGRGAANVFAGGDPQVAAYVNDIFENPTTGMLWGIMDALDDLTVEEIAERLEAGATAHAVGHTAAVAAGVPSALRYIGVFGVAADRLIHRANLTRAGALDVYLPRTNVKDDPVVPRSNCVGYSEAYNRHWLVHPLTESTETVTPRAAAPARGARETAPTRTTVKVVTTPFDVRQMDIEEANRLTVANELRWCPVCFPDPAREIAEARAAKARGGDASHGAHGHEEAHAHETPAAPRKSLFERALASGRRKVVRVMNGISCATLNPGQAALKFEFYKDIEREGISEELLEALDDFCGGMSDPPTSQDIDNFFNWLDDNVPGVEESVASTWKGWFWQQRRKVARYWGYALLALIAALGIVGGLAALAWKFGLGPVYKFFLDGFAAAEVNIVNPGKWAYETMTQMFTDMAGASIASIALVDPVLANLLKVEGTVFLLGVLCTLISVWGQWVLIRFRFAPEGDERFRNVGRDCVLFLVELAALYAIFIMFWIPSGWALAAVVSLMMISVGARMAYRSQGGMEATIRDNLRQTHQFLMFRLSAVFVAQVILRFVFPTELTLLHTQLTAFIGTNGLTFLAAVMLAGGWAALTMRSTATPAERASYNTALSYVLALVVLVTFVPPVWGEVKNTTSGFYHTVTESVANGWTHFWNPSDSWKALPPAPAAATKWKVVGAAPAAPVIKAPAAPIVVAPTQAPPAHSPAPAAATPTNPALKRFCDSLGSVQRSQTAACKGI